MTLRPTDVAESLAAAIRAERLRIVAGLIRVTGDWDLAEDCVQDAVERALATWPRDGVPDNPAAWLTTAARRRALDSLRRRRSEADKLRELKSLAELERPVTVDVDPYPDLYRDDRLRLLFTCCHPALPLSGQVALTLRTVAGLTTAEIAEAFLVSESTMAQRLLRTRKKIAHTGISFKVPEPHRIGERTAGVLAVIYLIFNQGYAVTDDDRHDDLAGEAIRLAQLLTRLLPADDEAQGLTALLFFQHSRRATRVDADGELAPMEVQDRTRWDRLMVAGGLARLTAARDTGRRPGYYRLQAEIAAEHATAESARETDWSRIVKAYDALLELQSSPVVALNRAVAVSFCDGPEAGLTALAQVEGDVRLAGYRLLPAVRADLLRRAGRGDEAAVAYRAAIEQARTDAERRFLERRLAEIAHVGDDAP